MSVYEALKAHGHSAAKAAEIMLDAKRGDEYARQWIAQVATPRSEPPAVDGEAS